LHSESITMLRVAENSPIRVALVEDDLQSKGAVVAAIQACSTMKLVEIAATRAEGLLMLERAPADVLLVDLGLPDGSGVDVIRAAAVKWPDCGVLVSTIFDDEIHIMQAIEAGASGYLLKDSSAKNMLDEIRCVSEGGSPISPSIARLILKQFRRAHCAPQGAAPTSTPTPTPTPTSISTSPPKKSRSCSADETSLLSARETEVLELVTKGFTANEISEMMQLSRHTILTFVRRIYTKLKVTSKAEAIYEARNRGFLAD